MRSELIKKENYFAMEEIVEKKELDPTNLEDLDFLLYNAEGLVKEILNYEIIAQSENFSSLTQYSKIGGEVFSSVNEVYGRLENVVSAIKNQVSSDSPVIDDAQIDEIQNLYDGLISIRNTFLRTYGSLNELEVFDSEIDSTDDPAEADNYSESAVAGEINETDKFDEEVTRFEVVPVTASKNEVINQNIEEDTEAEDDWEEDFKIDSDINRSDMVVLGEDIEFAIPIKLAPDTEKLVINNWAREIEELGSVLFVEENLTADENSALAKTEAKDPINQVVPVRENIFTKGSNIQTENDNNKGYIIDDSYKQIKRQKQKQIINESPEKKLANFVKSFERQSLDGIERWLGTEYENTFELIKDMTLEEVINMSAEKNIRKELISENYKYETFVNWIDLSLEISSTFEVPNNIKFSDLILKKLNN